MARRPRLDMAGFHHIVNRGVERKKIFKWDDDKDKFLEILCKACRLHKVDIHTYCLMDNHYHLLIETSLENLSLFMRQVSSNYAIYFNKKYKRVGHLWQGRYKSWYVTDDNYLYSLFKYIEYNPVDAKITNNIGEYPFTLLGTIINTNLSIVPCALNSRLKNELKDIKDYLSIKFTKKELKGLQDEQKKIIIRENNIIIQEKSKTLKEHLNDTKDLIQRNKGIINAIEDGYKQSEIAKYLKVSPAMISKVFRNIK
jgi:REP element-mobilizing transposase RayT